MKQAVMQHKSQLKKILGVGFGAYNYLKRAFENYAGFLIIMTLSYPCFRLLNNGGSKNIEGKFRIRKFIEKK